jgi:hypothetical protein
VWKGSLAVVLLALGAGALHAQQPVRMPRPSCVARGFVPALAPDTVAEAVLDSLGTVDVGSQPGVRYIRNLLAASFEAGASRELRQAAVDGVCGVVVGGDHGDGGDDGYYLIRLRGAGTAPELDAMAAALRQMPGVRSAQALAIRGVDPPAALPTVAERSAGCADATDGGWLRIAAIKEIVSSPGADQQHLALRLGLAGVDSGAVRVEQDDAVCARVAAAIREGAHFSLNGMPYLVLRAGPRYIAFDPSGLNRSFFVVDTTFVFRTVVY